MFLITLAEKGGGTKQLTFDKEELTLGRLAGNDLVLNKGNVSKYHSRFVLKDGKYIVVDLKSTNGTFINGKKIGAPQVVRPADRIQIGDYTINIDAPSDEDLAALESEGDDGEVGDGDDGYEPEEDEDAERPQAKKGNMPASLASALRRRGKGPDPKLEAYSNLQKDIHDRLIEYLDLRRLDMDRLGDEELWRRTEKAIRDILEQMEGDQEIPPDIDREMLLTDVLNEALGLGPLEAFLADDDISEIMVNHANQIYIEKKGKLTLSDKIFSSNQAVLGVIERIVAPIGRRIDESSPMVDARLKDGSRVNAIIPPLALKGPCITIRKFKREALRIEDLIKYKTLTPQMAEFLEMCVKAHRNTVISGGTGSGKTTTLNIVSSFIPEDERIITVEDAAELQLHQEHWVQLESRPANLEGKGAVTIRDLVKNCLRMRPERIVVGECRSGEALDMLQAMNTGHDGSLTTLHANTPRDALARLETLVLMAGMDLPVKAIREQIASAVHIIVQQSRFSDGTRKIAYITEISGHGSRHRHAARHFHLQARGLHRRPQSAWSLRGVGVRASLLRRAAAPGHAGQHGHLSGGLTMPTLVVRYPDGADEEHDLSGELTFGRAEGNDVVLPEGGVSRKHARFFMEDGHAHVEDAGSANGTYVDGKRIASAAMLTPGSVVVLGDYEVTLKVEIKRQPTRSGVKAARAPAPSGKRAAVPSRGGRALPRGGDDDEPKAIERSGTRRPVRTARDRAAPSAPAPKKGSKRLMVVAVSVVGLLTVLAVAKVALRPKPPVTSPKPTGPSPGPDTAEPDLEELLSACRQYSSTDSAEPNWARAEEACNRVLELEPIHKDANELMKKIKVNRACEQDLKHAKELVQANRTEEAVDFFAKIRPDCGYFVKALDAARDPIDEFKKVVGNECKQYSTNAKWENAYRRCELYTKLACQMMERDDRQLPPLMHLKLDGPLGKSDWRPKDPLYVNFLKAREKVKPGEPPWQCPELLVFRPPRAAEDPTKQLKEGFGALYPDPEMGRALSLYFDGKFQEMRVPLGKILDNMEKSKVHEQARELLRDMDSAANQYQSGSTEVGNGKLDKAAGLFRGALAVDEKLVLHGVAVPTEEARKRELERRRSFVRKSVIEIMTANALRRGREYADRNDFRQACRVWKLGAAFSLSNLDLLKALQNGCTKHASEAFKSADNCEAYRGVLDYAVDGDGYKEKAKAAMAENNCTE